MGAIALATSPHLQNVTTLNLEKNRFGIDGVRALASSPYLPHHVRARWEQLAGEGE